MAKDPEVQIQELILSNTISISALMSVLERKGIVMKEEVLQEVDKIKRKLDEEAKKN